MKIVSDVTQPAVKDEASHFRYINARQTFLYGTMQGRRFSHCFVKICLRRKHCRDRGHYGVGGGEQETRTKMKLRRTEIKPVWEMH